MSSHQIKFPIKFSSHTVCHIMFSFYVMCPTGCHTCHVMCHTSCHINTCLSFHVSHVMSCHTYIEHYYVLWDDISFVKDDSDTVMVISLQYKIIWEGNSYHYYLAPISFHAQYFFLELQHTSCTVLFNNLLLNFVCIPKLNVYDHTTLKAPVFIWSLKLSSVGQG